LSPTKNYLCRSYQDKDKDDIRKLVGGVFQNFLEGKYWDWKYYLDPDFDPSLVAVAEKDGKIIGCNHWLMRRFKISRSVQVNAFLGADIAVAPEYRGRGIGKSLLLFLRSSEAIAKKEATLSYMFADIGLSKGLYEPVAYYITVPTATVSYFRLSSWKKLMGRLSIINSRVENEKRLFEELSKTNLRILFLLSGAPPILIETSNGHVEARETDLKDPCITITSDFLTMTVLKEKKGRMRNIMKALIRRKLKVKGSFFNLLRLRRILWLLEDIFSKDVL